MYQNGSRKPNNNKGKHTTNNKGKSFHDNGNFNKPRVKREPRPIDIDAINKVKDSVITTVKSSIDKEKFSYKINISDKKIENGILAVTFKIQGRSEDITKTLLFTVKTDRRSGNHSLMILSINVNEAHILFSADAKDLTEKIEKYVPNIVKSTVKMLPDSNKEVTE